MALIIRKTIKDSTTGSETYLEGTEAEVEAYERKQEKKRTTKEQSEKKRKKDLLLGMTVADLRMIVQEEIAVNARAVEHHWHWTNGWWWRQTSPYQYDYTSVSPYLQPSQIWYTFNKADDLSNHLGQASGYVQNILTSSPYFGGASNLISNAVVTNATNTQDGSFSIDATARPVSQTYAMVGAGG
jgi:hypothetical protein